MAELSEQTSSTFVAEDIDVEIPPSPSKQSQISVEKDVSPANYDVIFYSCNWDFEVGPLQNFILSALDATPDDKQLFYDEKNAFEINSIGSRLLVGAVSIPPQKSTLRELDSFSAIVLPPNIISAVKKVIEFELRSLNSEKAARNNPFTLWMPLLGTGAAGLSYIQSAQIIHQTLTELKSSSDLDKVFKKITIALPPEISEDEEANVRALFDGPNATPISEMPDQFHADRPVDGKDGDDLGRDAIARTIALNVSRVWASQIEHSRPFAVHLSGRWGSGKSSILNLLRNHLETDTKHPITSPGTINPPEKKGWVTVDYNAWQMQDTGPPWWSLRNAVADQGYRALGPRGYWLRVREGCWRQTQMYRQWFWIAGILLTLATLTYLFAPQLKGMLNVEGNLFWKTASSVAALSALFGFLLNFTKSASEKAEALRSLHSNPTKHLQKRYTKMIKDIDRPVAVFIDDLDRCDAQFVVDLLQSLQTSYADVPVLYVVASDRDWIVSAYNQIYKEFKQEVSQPGQPLGYLFVEKIFQLSVPVPDLADSETKALTRALMGKKIAATAPVVDREIRAKEVTEHILNGDNAKAAEVQADALASGQDLSPEMMAASTSDLARAATEHRLLEDTYIALFDKNPRAIKRMINALTFRQGYILAAAEHIPFDTIARWTILNLRYPYASDHLSVNPHRVVNIGEQDMDSELFPNPENIKTILGPISQSDIELIRGFG